MSRVTRALIVACAMSGVACEQPRDLTRVLQVADVTTGWYDAGIVEGKNKLVPSVSFKIKNVGSDGISSVQVNAIFRRGGDTPEDELDASLVRAIGTDGLPSGSETPPITIRSKLGYTGEQPRAEMMQHRLFQDASVVIFAKHGSAQWVELAKFPIDRQLLTH